MEENTEISQNAADQNLQAAETTNSNIVGEKTVEERIGELAKSLSKVEDIFKKHGREITRRMIIWMLILLIVLSSIISFYYCVFSNELTDVNNPVWAWYIGYKIAIRATALIALFTGLGFCIKMVRSYLFMFENNKHKQAIVKSMSFIVGSGISSTQRETIYTKMIDLVIKMGNTGLLSKESDIKNFELINELISKLTPKKD